MKTDFVEIFDIVDGKEFKLGRYCGLHKPPAAIYSNGHELRITFFSGQFSQFNGFRILYSHDDTTGILKYTRPTYYFLSKIRIHHVLSAYLYIPISVPCRSGPGKFGSIIKEFQKCSLIECKQECTKEINCTGFDYSKFCKNDSCRLYDSNFPRKDLDPDNRIYCQNIGMFRIANLPTLFLHIKLE